MDDLDIKLRILGLFVDIMVDALAREDYRYLHILVYSDFLQIAVDTWKLIDHETYSAFCKLLKDIKI
jgi:hypothetical protein